MKFPTEVQLNSSRAGRPIGTVEEAIALIDRDLPPELAKLPRWTFARALLDEALRTGKSRDLKTALRQFKQALKNERWLA